ncbi:hypothetical protein B0H66DRAFT_110372 [Apodospora peruviana]|uniref:Uncharacterized protein n=1 Tax=Apodospora peruviana TaxID=516989 RepID=A0AAE0IH66_9PEZI|nr:hypothetical protein B0H66DRAFT_110372 [Apodospora peruviana]
MITNHSPPFNKQVESLNTNQILRAIDHRENQRQGVDFSQWKAAIWVPCLAIWRANGKSGQPPVTVTWASIQPGDDRLLPTGVIRKYGVSYSLLSL